MHFRGNFPRGVRIEALDAGIGDGIGEEIVGERDGRWIEVLGTQACTKDKEHEFVTREGELKGVEGKAFTHLKMIIEPDGGVKRFRVFGTMV